MTVKELTSKMDMFQEVAISEGWSSAGLHRCTVADIPVSLQKCEVTAIGTHDNSSEIIIDVA